MTTLIEKLEQVKEKNKDNFNKTGDRDYAVAIGVTQHCINIVKQHSGWQNLSRDTQLQDGQTDAVIEHPQALIERIQLILDDLMMECFKHGFHQKEMTEAEFIDYSRKNCVPLKREIIGILKQHSEVQNV